MLEFVFVATMPSAKEMRQAQRVIKKLTPSMATYSAYRQLAERWLTRSRSAPQVLRYAGFIAVLSRARLELSQVSDREYLVAEVPHEWMHNAFAHTDALAAEPVQAGWPPLVLVPESRRGSERRERYRSILEHEFVHINQILLGTFQRGTMAAVTARALLPQFFEYVRNEYEANLVQLAHWPKLYPRSIDLSLDGWCALLGYSQALEQAIASMSASVVQAREAVRFVETLPKVLGRGLQRVGIDTNYAEYFRDRWLPNLITALAAVAEERPTLRDNRVWRALARHARNEWCAHEKIRCREQRRQLALSRPAGGTRW